MNILFLTSAAPDKAGFSTAEKRPPLGLGYLMAILKSAGHKVFFSDEYLQPTDILTTDFLSRNFIDMVGIYANTICFDATRSMLSILQGKRESKEWCGKIMVGGPHTSVGLDDIPDFVDHVVVGEGEISVRKIIDGEVTDRIINGERVEDLDSLPLPAWEEFVWRPYDWRIAWHSAYPVYTFNTSRGCPFDCTFCSVKAVWGKTYRFMSAERVVSDIEHMIRYYGARGIYFREDHFTLNKGRVLDFCNLVLAKNLQIDWFCETRVDQLCDYNYQKLMADAGCKAFYIGVESGSPKMLEFYQKGETREQFIEAIQMARRVGIKTYASFVVGLPEETEEDVRLTDELIEIAKPDYVSKNVFLGIPGSDLYEYLRVNKLYEYEDQNHILYPCGYAENVKKYYGNNPYYNVYSNDKTSEGTFVNQLKKRISKRFQ